MFDDRIIVYLVGWKLGFVYGVFGWFWVFVKIEYNFFFLWFYFFGCDYYVCCDVFFVYYYIGLRGWVLFKVVFDLFFEVDVDIMIYSMLVYDVV